MVSKELMERNCFESRGAFVPRMLRSTPQEADAPKGLLVSGQKERRLPLGRSDQRCRK